MIMRLLLPDLRGGVAASGDDLNPAVSPHRSMACREARLRLGVTGGNSDVVCLLEGPQCRTIGNVDERQLKGPADRSLPLPA